MSFNKKWLIFLSKHITESYSECLTNIDVVNNGFNKDKKQNYLCKKNQYNIHYQNKNIKSSLSNLVSYICTTTV
ncbi:hypothetical protein CCPUN_02270 [Cardinium endosymbiont of Culicoides punctatus]|nr:hypothetical protein CCPUN_02270 [Cardinium endosymbiont of Culicoides punctatus]